MSTADHPRTKKHDASKSHHQAKHADHDADEPQGKPRKRKSRAFRYGCWATLVLLAIVVYCAPMIIAKTPLADVALTRVLAIDGSASVGSLSLDWFSSVAAENLEIRDADGNLLVEIGVLETGKPLVGLLIDFADVGQVHLERVTLHVVADEADTNFERTFAALLTKGDNAPVPDVELDVVDGALMLDDKAAGQQFHIDGVKLQCSLSNEMNTLNVHAEGTIAGDSQPGGFKIDAQAADFGTQDAPLGNGKVDCQVDAVPLELAGPVLRRALERARLSGRLTSRLNGAWGKLAENGEASLSGETLVSAVSFTSAAIGGDAIQLARIELPCRVAQSGDSLVIERLGATCELGSLTVSGSVRLADFADANHLLMLAHENYEVQGNLDLARLASLLPKTLRLRDGLEITSGQVALAASSRRQGDVTTWSGHLDASHLGANSDGRSLVWENPLAIDFTARDTKDGLVVDNADCTSSFLQVEATGSADDLTLSAKFDLARLESELNQFADLHGFQCSGQGQAHLNWKRTDGDAFATAGTFQAQNFQLVVAGSRPWQEPKVAARLDAAGQLAGHTIKLVNRLQVTVEAAGDRFDAALVSQTADANSESWPIRCTWNGQLEHWAPRLETCLGISGWDLAGGGKLDANVTCSAKTIDVETCKIDLARLQVYGHGWFVNEPTASATLGAHYDLAGGRLDIEKVKLTSVSLAATVDKASLAWTADGWSFDGGTAQVASDLTALYRWRHDPRMPAPWQVAGRLNGQAELKLTPGVTNARFDGTIDQLQVVDLTSHAGGVSTWREPQVALAARANYQSSNRQLQIEKLQLAAAALGCDASGTVVLSDAGNDIDLKGTVQYDWQQLAPLWRPYLGPSVAIAGRQTRPFSVRGRAPGDFANFDALRGLTGEAAIGWSGANVAGLAVGPGEVAMQLADGRVQTRPIDVTLGEGRFTATPIVQISPGPIQVLVPGGPLLTSVHLSPEMCARGMKFIAPVLAQSTVADGVFSVVMDGGHVPLFDPGAGDASGRLAIRAQAKPGPVAQQFLVILGELTTILGKGTALSLNDQAGSLVSIDSANVEFRMVAGRVYHRGLTFKIGTMPVTTHGSVGLDETLSIVAEVPVKANLLGQDLSLGLLEGQTLQIPIEGTLTNPKFEPRVLQQLTGGLLKNAGKGQILNEVGKTIDKLLPAR